MPQNDPATDSINYAASIGIGIVEFDNMLFEEIEDDDLFWFSDNQNSDQNHAFRKLSDSTAMDTKNRNVVNNIEYRLKVYQKT
jgi:hypothetical protein